MSIENFLPFRCFTVDDIQRMNGNKSATNDNLMEILNREDVSYGTLKSRVSDYCGEAFDNNALRDSILEQITLSEIHNRKFTKIQMNYATMLVATKHYIPYDSGKIKMWGLEIEIINDFHDGLFSLAGEGVPMSLYCKDCGYERSVNCICDGSFERTQIVQLEKRVAELERKIREMDNKVSIARGIAEAAGGRTS